MKIPKKWRLPPPPKGPKNIWKPYVSYTKTAPFGYYRDENEPTLFWPIPEQLDLLEQAKKYLKEYSYAEVAEWLTKQSGRYISKPGLKHRIDGEKRRRKLAYQARFWQKEAEKAAAIAEELEKTLGGGQLRDTIHPEDCSCSTCTGDTD